MDPTAVRLVIFDSECLLRDSLSQVLNASEGMQVVGKTSRAEEFHQVLRDEKPNVALMDWVKGDPEEIRTLEEARLSQPETKFIVMASHPDSMLLNKSVQAGAWALIDKSAAGSDVAVNTVMTVAMGQRVFPPHLLEPRTATSPPPVRHPLLQTLSAREREVLGYVAAGTENCKIAAHLGIGERMVKAHVSSLYRKLGSQNRIQLALLALKLGVQAPTNL